MDISIANGASLSSAIDLGNTRLSYIVMPSAWTAANLTFQVSEDGVTYADLYNDSGTEYTVTAAASRTLRVTLPDWLAIRYLKVRSGTSASPVTQGAARTLQLGTVSAL
jgi:hypothetical protein